MHAVLCGTMKPNKLAAQTHPSITNHNHNLDIQDEMDVVGQSKRAREI